MTLLISKTIFKSEPFRAKMAYFLETGLLSSVSQFLKSKPFQPKMAFSWKLAYFFKSKPICMCKSQMELIILCLNNKLGLLILSDEEKNDPTTHAIT